MASVGSGTRYAHTVDGFDIAYQVHGDGPVDLLVVPGVISHVEFELEWPQYQRFVDRLAAFARVIRFDKRGNGLSDRIPGAPTLEERIDDVRAVLDAVGSTSAALFGISEGGPMSILFAATYPQRTRSLMLWGTFARFMNAPDYPFGANDEILEWLCGPAVDEWGEGAVLDLFAPSIARDPEARALAARFERLSATPAAMRALWRMNASIDVRSVLASVRVPTLVLYRTRDVADIRRGYHLAESIPGARMVEFDGGDHLPWIGDADAVVDEIEEFVTGQRHDRVDADRVLATIVFSDIVGSTATASERGDRQWRALLDQHDLVVDRQIDRFRGRKVKSTGDGVLALFDGPGRAVRCAAAIRDGLRGVGLETRLGVHTGEIELRGDDVGGIAVHVAQRVETQAGVGEVLCSRTVVDLVAGSGLAFVDRGEHELKGVPGSWRLFQLADA